MLTERDEVTTLPDSGEASLSPCCIIVACYGQAGLLPEALCSAVSQSPRCRIVLVNDGCLQQETGEICRAFAQAFPELILYIHQANGGPAHARNTGIDLAIRAWPDIRAFFFLDGDNRLKPATIRRMYAELLATGADWVFTSLSSIGESQSIGMAGEYSVLEQAMTNFVDTGSLLARRVIDAGTRFDERLKGFEDWDFFLQAARLGFMGTYLDAAGFLYRRRPESYNHEAIHNQAELLGTLRRKHADWLGPRGCIALEHHESPRYALLEPDGDRVSLFTDPGDRRRWLPANEFVAGIAHAAASGNFGRVPAFLVNAVPAILEELGRRRLLHWAFWQLESQLSSGQFEVGLIERQGSFLIGPVTGGPAGAMIFMARVDRICARRQGSVAGPLTELPLPIDGPGEATAALEPIMSRIRQIAGSLYYPALFSENAAGRRHDPAAYGLRQLFATGPLFPLASEQPRVGILVESKPGVSCLDRIARFALDASARGWSTHLLGLRSAVGYFNEIARLVDSLAVLSDEDSQQAGGEDGQAGLLGWLHQMDVIVNRECVDALPLSGALKRLGIKSLFSVGDSPDVDRILSLIDVGMSHENALEGYLFDSKSLAGRFQALGIPRSKIYTGLETFLTSSLGGVNRDALAA